MSDENIKQYTRQELEDMRTRGESQTDWHRLETMTDEEIDYSDIPPIPENFWQKAKVVIPQHNQEPITLEVDREILNWFKATGNYQSRMNDALRIYVHKQKEFAQ